MIQISNPLNVYLIEHNKTSIVEYFHFSVAFFHKCHYYF